MAHVECFEEMVGTREAAAVATESGGDETATKLGTKTGGPMDKTDDKTVATAGDKRDGGDRWNIVCGRRSVYNRRLPC